LSKRGVTPELVKLAKGSLIVLSIRAHERELYCRKDARGRQGA